MNRLKPYRARHARRGTVYILVLGVVAMLVVFGVGGAMLARNATGQSKLHSTR